MFLFKKAKKNEEIFSSDIEIMFFGNSFYIKVINEIEGTGNVTKEIEIKALEILKEKTKDIQIELEKYVKDNYSSIIEDYYLEIDGSTLKKSEYDDYLQLMDDLKNNSRLHTDIIIKNIRPVYFSVTSEETSYLFAYVNYVDEIGIDIELNTKIIIHEHE